MNPTANPLRQYFRRPSIYLRLPSGGDFWPPESLSATQNGELPIFPMTAIDEITYRTPDALFNGDAVVSVIQSCVPNIVNAWDTPASDLNSILVAIRIASYGHELEMGSTCPACQNEGEYKLDLRTVLDQLQAPNFKHSINHGDLQIFFQPISYRHQHETNAIQFEEQKTIQMIPGSDLPDEEKIKRLNGALKRITELTVNALKYSIAGIKTPTALVTEPEFIQEFLNNCDRTLFNQIRDHVIDVKAEAEMQPFEIQCPEQECKNKYMQTITLDMTSFFEDAS